MPYSLNPYLPRVRAKGVNLIIHDNWSIRAVARHLGVEPSTVSRWMRQAPKEGTVSEIPTRSSKPHHSPLALERSIVDHIVELRRKRGRCAQVIHAQLLREHVEVSLSTVKRTLARRGLLKKRSPWKKYHFSGERPVPQAPGILVEIDSIHRMRDEDKRLYIVTLVDCFSRWAWAQVVMRLTPKATAHTLLIAQENASFPFRCIQSDHGSEFSTYFTRMVESRGIRHRHCRVRKPNDQAHVERFNRTLQDEMRYELIRYKNQPKKLQLCLKDYLRYYNTERLHMGIDYQTPLEVLRRY